MILFFLRRAAELCDSPRPCAFFACAQPRASAALEEHAEEGLPWDLVAACCMLDACAGAGGAFWAEYATSLLPQPGSMPLPLLLRPDALDVLRSADPVVASNAEEQRQRLAEVLPTLATAQPPLAHGFALVRSRAFALGGNAFALVPFADLANHAANPAADLIVPFGDDGLPSGGAKGAPPTVRLAARRDLRAGDEVTICYSGNDSGYDNRRLMALHGFAPAGGNRHERLPLSDDVAPLCLEWLQEAVGDVAWMGMLLGENERLYAALSSMPTRNEAHEASAAPAQLRSARALRAAVASAMAALPARAEDDAAALAAAEAQGDVHMAAALRYRLERALLWAEAESALQLFERSVQERFPAA